MTEFYNIRSVNNVSKSELTSAFQRVLESGWYILGNEVNKFESEFANFCEVRNCVGVGNCLDALQFILQGINIGAGDEVIVPSNTYIATWLAVSNVGATPVPVEPLIDTYNIDPSQIQDSITSRTKAIIVVHLYGQPCDMDPINEIADKHIPGFGEVFRTLSLKTVGTSSIQSRACAVLAGGKYVFALPGSSGGVTDAWDGILKHQLDINHKPCNFVELFPRLKEK